MNTMTPQKAFENMSTDPRAVLIDVRETSEFSEGHAAPAQNIPLALLPLRIKEFSDASQIFFICQSGGRSGQATAFALSVGLHQASNVSGGTAGWMNAGLPMTERAGPSPRGSIKSIAMIIGAIVIVGALLTGSGLFAGNAPEVEAKIERVAAQEFSQAATQGDGTILDVRTSAEFAGGHIAGATLIDWNSPSFSSQVAALDASKKYLVYCHSGNRSAKAVAAMRGMGFTNITELSGGIIAWEKSGLPLER